MDSAERLLLRAGQPVALTPKAFDVLLHLVERHGRLLTKQELMSTVWPDTFVEEANLTYTVSALRKALGDGQNGEHFIQTVPTRGYRFVAHVAPVAPAGAEPISSPVETPVRALPLSVGRTATIGLAVVATALLSVAADRRLRHPAATPVLVRFTIPVPDSPLNSVSWPMSQISPDGRRVAFNLSMGSTIWLREIAGEAARPIRRTEGAQALFWAPDSQQLAFTSSSALKRLSLADGAVQTLCDSCEPTGGTWSRHGTIVFTTRDGPLLGIPAAGGTPQAVTSLDRSRGEISHTYPHFLPDGVRFLYLSRSADASRTGLYIGQVGSLQPRLLLKGDVPAIYAEPGYLVFLRAGTLMAQRFDPERLTFSGDARPVVAAPRQTLLGQPAFSASNTGVLTYSLLERPLMQFQWVGRGGVLQGLVGEPGAYYTFDLSPDASRLAFVRFESPQDGSLWVLDIERGVTTRVTFGDSLHADPRWTAGAHHLVATRWQPEPQAIVLISPDGVETTLPVAGAGNMVDDVAPDGQHLLYHRHRQLLSLSLSKKSTPVLIHKPLTGGINQAQYAPDSGWIAYHSNESGRFDVYVTSSSPGGPRWQVSSAGGLQPVWRQDGRELYYLGLDGTLYAVAVGRGEPPHFSPPRRLFKTGLLPTPSVEQYAASRDGQRFLLLRQVGDNASSSIGVVLDWPALLSIAR